MSCDTCLWKMSNGRCQKGQLPNYCSEYMMDPHFRRAMEQNESERREREERERKEHEHQEWLKTENGQKWQAEENERKRKELEERERKEREHQEWLASEEGQKWQAEEKAKEIAEKKREKISGFLQISIPIIIFAVFFIIAGIFGWFNENYSGKLDNISNLLVFIIIGSPVIISSILISILALRFESYICSIFGIILVHAIIIAIIMAEGFWGFIGYLIGFCILNAIFALPGFLISLLSKRKSSSSKK